MTDFWRRIPRHVLIRLGYLIAGAKIGALWLAQGDSSPWEHALRLLALMASVMAVAEVARRWAARRGRRVNHHAVGRFIVVKVGLMALAVAAGLLLQNQLVHVDVWVSVGLAVVVAGLGPVIHPWLVKSHAGPAEADVDQTDAAAVAAA
ncbi:hypothetical protein BH09ACT8_BH09ACT8_03870 [soil metagenome]